MGFSLLIIYDRCICAKRCIYLVVKIAHVLFFLCTVFCNKFNNGIHWIYSRCFDWYITWPHWWGRFNINRSFIGLYISFTACYSRFLFTVYCGNNQPARGGQ